jgi:hypothetical protein
MLLQKCKQLILIVAQILRLDVCCNSFVLIFSISMNNRTYNATHRQNETGFCIRGI